MVYLMYDYCIK